MRSTRDAILIRQHELLSRLDLPLTEDAMAQLNADWNQLRIPSTQAVEEIRSEGEQE